MSKPVCPNCMKVDYGAILPSDHGSRFYSTRCGNCNHRFMYNAKGVVQSGHEEPRSSNGFDVPGVTMDQAKKAFDAEVRGAPIQSENLLSSNERVSDTELRLMIGDLEAFKASALSITQKWQLSALRELLERRAAAEPADDLYALLVRRGYAQHEAHAIAFGDKLAVLSSSPPPPAGLNKVLEPEKYGNGYRVSLIFLSEENAAAAYLELDRPELTKCVAPKCLVLDCVQPATKDGSWCETHYNSSHIWP